jgi:hypothetical protein
MPFARQCWRRGARERRPHGVAETSGRKPAKLAKLGYTIAERGSVTRVTGAPSVSARTERLTHAVPSAFYEMDVIEITLSGK